MAGGLRALLMLAGLGLCCAPEEVPPQTVELYRLSEELPLAQTTPSSGDASAEATSIPGRDRLWLSAGSRIDYFFKLPPGSELRLGRWSLRGSGKPDLEFLLETDEGGNRRLASLRDLRAPARVSLTTGDEAAARLTLHATGGGDGEGAGSESGVLLEAARVVAAERVDRTPVSLSAHRVRRANIVVYLVDALRADHLGCYGYPVNVSPNLDRFAADAALFERAVGQSSWTRPSVVSLFTGTWPGQHGVTGRKHLLSPDAITLAELLSRHGYRTAAIVTNPNVSEAFGLDQGFEHFHYQANDRSSDHIVRLATDWLQSNGSDGPFFLYLHTNDPHHPYLPKEPYRNRFAGDADEVLQKIRRNPRRERWSPEESTLAQLRSLYDAEIAFNDESFGVLLRALEEQDLFERTVVIFLSDHGEEFHEHGRWTHGHNLHVDTIGVPLVMKLAGMSERVRISEPVQHIDLLPTLLDYLEIDIPSHVEGRSLLPLLTAGRLESSGIFSHLELYGRRHVSLVDGRWKLIQWQAKDSSTRSRLYDLQTDPGESTDLSQQRPVLARVMETMIERRFKGQRGVPRAQEAVLDEPVRRDLQALGYLD